MEVLLGVMQELEGAGFLKWPKVFLHPNCEPEAASLKTMITALKGEVASSAGKFSSLLLRLLCVSLTFLVVVQP